MVHKTVFAVVLIGLAVLASSGFLWYRSQAVHRYHEAQRMYEGLDAEGALDLFREVSSYPSILGGLVGEAQVKVRGAPLKRNHRDG